VDQKDRRKIGVEGNWRGICSAVGEYMLLKKKKKMKSDEVITE
jgi:hypothetical protein